MKIWKLLPIKTLINLVFLILFYIVSKTKNVKDDLIVLSLFNIWKLILPVIPEEKRK